MQVPQSIHDGCKFTCMALIRGKEFFHIAKLPPSDLHRSCMNGKLFS